MRKFLSQNLVAFAISTILFSGCTLNSPQQNSNFNAHLPPSSEQDPQFIEQANPPPTLNVPIEIDEEVWDLSDVDVSHIHKDKKLISFTFDDAPARTLENIFAVFAAFNESHPDNLASATVFFNGGRFDKQTKHLLYTAYALGFELGNHTQSHLDLTTLTEQEIEAEISKTDALLSEIDHKPLHLLRAPFGKTDATVKAIVKTPIIDWTIDTLDWTGIDANGIYEHVFSNRQDGAIVLMHDGYEATVSALKRLLPDLANDGYQVVSVSALAKAHNCTLRKGRVYIRARKQL